MHVRCSNIVTLAAYILNEKNFQRSPTSLPVNKLTANFFCPLQICSKAPLPKWEPKKPGTQARRKGFVATLLAKISQQTFANLHQSTLLAWCAPPCLQNCEQTRANSLKCFPQIDAKETPFWGSESNHENGGYFRPSFPCFISQRNSSLLWVSFSDPQNGVLSRQFVETFVVCWQFCGHGGSQQASKVDWCKFGNYGW